MTRIDQTPFPPQAGLPAQGFVRLPQILAVFPVGRSSWWAGVKSGRYPAAIKLGPRTTAWRVEDIRWLIESGVNGPGARP